MAGRRNDELVTGQRREALLRRLAEAEHGDRAGILTAFGVSANTVAKWRRSARGGQKVAVV